MIFTVIQIVLIIHTEKAVDMDIMRNYSNCLRCESYFDFEQGAVVVNFL